MITTNTLLAVYLLAHAVVLGMLGIAGLWARREE
jgi:hypothetical protein